MAAVPICGSTSALSSGAVAASRRAVDGDDLRAILNVITYAVMAALLLVVGAYTAGVAAGLAVQGFELVR